ncbi:hypothetical protein Tco_1415453, partial [Tanacetum coccineum]
VRLVRMYLDWFPRFIPELHVFLLGGTDKTKITRKPSKTGKHGYENGRACKSRKPKSKSQSSQSTMGQQSVSEDYTNGP